MACFSYRATMKIYFNISPPVVAPSCSVGWMKPIVLRFNKLNSCILSTGGHRSQPTRSTAVSTAIGVSRLLLYCTSLSHVSALRQTDKTNDRTTRLVFPAPHCLGLVCAQQLLRALLRNLQEPPPLFVFQFAHVVRTLLAFLLFDSGRMSTS